MSTHSEIESRGPDSFKDYLKEFKRNIGLLMWIWNDIISEKSKRWARYMNIIHVVGVVCVTISPLFIKEVMDNLPTKHDSGDMKSAFMAVLGFVGFLTIYKLLECGRRVIREYQLGENIKSMDRYVTEIFLAKSIGQHRREKKHLSVANVEKGRAKMLNIQSIILFEAFNVLFTLIISFIALLFLSPIAGLIICVFMIPYVVSMFYTNTKVARIAHPIDKKFRALFRYRTARWTNAMRVKLSLMSEKEAEKMDDDFDELLYTDRKFWLWFIKHITYRDMFVIGALASVVCYGIYEVFSVGPVSGGFTVGTLYPLITWANKIAENIWMVGNIEHQLNYNMPAVHALREVAELETDIKDPQEPKKFPKGPIGIEFRGVWFRHHSSVLEPDNKQKEHPHALQNVSFSIRPGETVGCVGPSGAGKSTLSMLLLRAYDPDRGQILVNGIDLKDLAVNDWWKEVGYIPQKSSIFDGTLLSNLTYGEDNVCTEHVNRVVRLLQIDFGRRLVDGLETKVGEDGIELSGGEQQRVSAGAAVIGNPRFMVIDEATSSLDSTTEAAFQSGLDHMLSEGVGAFIIAHRLSTLRRCDRIIVLRPSGSLHDDESQVEAIGSSFEELFEISPTFRQLAKDQNLKIGANALF